MKFYRLYYLEYIRMIQSEIWIADNPVSKASIMNVLLTQLENDVCHGITRSVRTPRY